MARPLRDGRRRTPGGGGAPLSQIAQRNAGAGRLIAAIFLFGLLVSALMVARSQVAGDQLNLLALGWLLAVEGQWVPLGNPATGGGFHPGGLTGLLVGLPLMVWSDHRAPAILVLAGQVGAYLLLDRLVRPIFRPQERVLFSLLYWLGPWRIFLSGFLWNPNFLFLPAALHLWTASALKRAPRFWPSAAHVLILGLIVQIHVGAVMLVTASALLWWRRYLHLHKRGAALGALVAALTLVPWAFALLEDPSRLSHGGSWIGRGFLLGYPILQAVMHWLRFAGLALGRSMVCLDFSELGGPGLAQIGPLLQGVRLPLALLTLVVGGWANWSLWRPFGRRWRERFEPSHSDREWLEGVVRWSLVALVATVGLSPIGVVYWQILPVFHLAILTVVLAAGRLPEGPRSRWVWRAASLYTAFVVLLGPALALGAPPYRCGEPRCDAKSFRAPAMRSDHPMFHQLGIHRTCPLVVDDPDGWWLEVLPEPGAAGP